MLNTLNEYIKYWSEKRGNSVALIDSSSKITYKELEMRIVVLKTFFKNNGICSEDIIAVSGPKNTILVQLYLSLFGIDVSVVPLPEKPNYSNVKKIIELTNPTYVIYYEDTMVTNHSGWFISEIDKFLDYQINKKISGIPIDLNEQKKLTDYKGIEKQVYFNLTSGSTGDLKAVKVGSEKIINNSLSVNKRFQLTEEDCYCCLFPPEMHPHEIFSHSIVAGGCCAILTSSDLRNFRHYIKEMKITHIHATPYIFEKLAFFCNDKRDWMNIKYLMAGGETATYNLRNRFHNKTHKKLISVWGSTETLGIVLAVPDDMAMDVNDLLGVPLEGYDIKIDPLTSELLIKGDSVAEKYWGTSPKTFLTDDGYYKTKDCVSLNKGGVYQYKGRMDYIIKACGRKISLFYVEQKLLSLKIVNEVALIYEESKMLIYVYMNLKNIDKSNIKIITDIIASYIHPIRYRIYLVDVLPKMSNGKINRNMLKQNNAPKGSILNGN